VIISGAAFAGAGERERCRRVDLAAQLADNLAA
jgi:hypothetical protein